MVKAVITIFVLLCLVFLSRSCVEIDISLTQNINDSGFHRYLMWLLESLQPSNRWWKDSNCSIALMVQMTSGLYVNPDELAELNRMGKLWTFIDGDVNVEAPSHEADEHTVYIFIHDQNLEKLTLKIPIHLRYQRAVIGGGFGKSELPKPSLLIRCPRTVNFCREYVLMSGPCDEFGGQCVWQNFTYKALFDDVELFVPVGNLDDFPLVSLVTLLLSCIGCIYILSLLSSAPV